MSIPDPYRIPGTEPPEQTQPPEHPRAVRRATYAIWIAGLAVLVAVIAAIFAGLQWKVAVRQADIADKALKLAENSAADQKDDVERSRKAAEKSANAAEIAAQSARRLASATENSVAVARTGIGVAKTQVEQMRRQVNAQYDTGISMRVTAKLVGSAPVVLVEVVNAGPRLAREITVRLYIKGSKVLTRENPRHSPVASGASVISQPLAHDLASGEKAPPVDFWLLSFDSPTERVRVQPEVVYSTGAEQTSVFGDSYLMSGRYEDNQIIGLSLELERVAGYMPSW